jgi:hypothetical protein
MSHPVIYLHTMKIYNAALTTLLCQSICHTTTAFASSSPLSFRSCTDYHCDVQQRVELSVSQWQPVRELFTSVNTPSEERERIRQAIALLEKIVGEITGTWRDLGGNVAGSGQAGQIDCISESKNTTTYLHLLFDDGLLRWHEVGERQLRRRFIIAQHWTAVIVDRSNGERFAVDSWYLDNGHPPMILPLVDWLAGRREDE